MPSELERRHQADAGALADDTAARVRQAARQADVADIDRWWDRAGPGLTRTVAQASAATSTLAGRYLVAEAAAHGLTGLEPLLAVVDLVQIATSLRVTGPIAFKQHIARTGDPERARQVMADRMAASADRLTMAGSRQTIADTAETSPLIQRYRRIAQSGACDFCSMLAGRGYVYRSEASAGTVVGRRGRPRGTRRVGQSYHDGCRCFLELGWADAAGQVAATPQPTAPAQPAPPPEPTEVVDAEPAETATTPEATAAPAGRGRAAELRAMAAEGENVDPDARWNRSGAQGRTEIVTLPDGRKFVDKRIQTWEGETEAEEAAANRMATDREELAALVADAVGVRAPTIARIGDDRIAMEFIDGKTGAELEYADGDAHQRAIEAGDRVGLLDIITGNQDRHGGNWIVTDAGDVVAIDHGTTWQPDYYDRTRFAEMPPDRAFTSRFISEPDPDDFDGDVEWRDPIDFPGYELDEIRERVVALRPEFERLGREDWHDFTMSRVDFLWSRAR